MPAWNEQFHSHRFAHYKQDSVYIKTVPFLSIVMGFNRNQPQVDKPLVVYSH